MSAFSFLPKFCGSKAVRGVVAVLVVVSAVASGAITASAAMRRAGWEITSRTYPTNLQPGGTGLIFVEVYNTGAERTVAGEPVTVTDALPAGLEAVEAGTFAPYGNLNEEEAEYYEEEEEYEEGEEKIGEVTTGTAQLRTFKCEGTTTVTCVTRPGAEGKMRPIRPGYVGRIGILVKVTGASGTGENHVMISGGGVLNSAESSSPVTISTSPIGFGVDNFAAWFTNEAGEIETQAGSHPYDLTIAFSMNAGKRGSAGGGLRNLNISLPPGLVGNPRITPQCTRQQFLSAGSGGCPPASQVGEDWAEKGQSGETGEGGIHLGIPVYNLVPPPGVPAEFAFTVFGANVFIDASVRSGSDYGISGKTDNVANRPVFDSITFWGNPSDPSHNKERCGVVFHEFGVACGFQGAAGETPQALFTEPTSCGVPLTLGLTAESWDKKALVARKTTTLSDTHGAPITLSGCERMTFEPTIKVAPDTSFADTPAGLSVDVKVSREAEEGVKTYGGVSTANIKDTTVTLPEGIVINPGQAAGLDACGAAEDGLTTEAEKAEGRENDGPAHCPSAARVGSDEIETPLLAKPLKGSVYVMPSDPPHVQLLVTAEGEGVFLKLVGDVHLNEQTGRLATTFSNTPELPFTDFKLSFSGGAQAALSTPLRCGTYTTTSDFTSWASPAVEDVFPYSSFQIAAGTGGAGCSAAGLLPFGPSLIAGSTTDQAGGFTDFSLLLTRPDDQQRISGLKFKTPEGLLGMISKVPLCPEAQANAGTCSGASQIGHTVVEAGPGPYPLVVPQPGQPPAPIYLTEGYKGAPYGLSIVVPLHVGPFVLPTQIVRARIEVDPRTTELTVTTDPLPQMIAGVPADLRAINAVIDRPGFMFNPTGCDPGSFSGTATGTEGASVPISTHFQMGSCRSLTFKPNFKVSTNAKTSRKAGASLDATIVYPKGPFADNQASVQSNVKAVKVDLPKQLPSRLTTLQKACPAKTFEANPTACPAGSVVGSASAETPVLPVKLTGPAYFVSYGGAKFPELVIVLQGYGVTVDLHGETFINEHTNITSSTFRQVPDVPITKFELKLPQGPNSALAAIGNLCAKKLVMPTVFTGQNGAQIKQATPITVNGCTKHKSKPKHKKRK